MTLSGYYTYGIEGNQHHELSASWSTCSPSVASWSELPENWSRICSRCGSDAGFVVVCYLVAIVALLSEIPMCLRRRYKETDVPLEKVCGNTQPVLFFLFFFKDRHFSEKHINCCCSSCSSCCYAVCCVCAILVLSSNNGHNWICCPLGYHSQCVLWVHENGEVYSFRW
jgi:hypothetical protein